VAGIELYATAIQPDWIDYNGHLRDAYYGLIVSLATDALMDRVGLDTAYRARTQCTLYTVEMHIHYLEEIKRDDRAQVAVRILGVDQKRIHAAFEIRRAGNANGVAATAEVMLLHVQQQQHSVKIQSFPPAVRAALDELAATSATLTAEGPASRRMELRPRGPAS
jgi:acyl-CoA thioester hydrolase